MKKYLLFFTLIFVLKNSYSQSCTPTYSTTNATICSNDLPYFWNLAEDFTASGTYYQTLTNAAGCDSILTLNLTVIYPGMSTTNLTLCSSQLPYFWNNQEIIEAGDYIAQLPNTEGCDSTANLILTVKASSTSVTNITICADKVPYTWNGKNYSTYGIYKDTLVNAVDCDSVATLNLTVNQLSTITSFSPVTAADGQAVVITGTNFTGATTVSFGGIPASSFIIISPTTIIATVGAATTGAVSVTIPCNTSSLPGFIYNTMPGNMGVGTSTPTSKFTISGGDLQITDIGSGIILKSPDGNCWRITIDNNGNLIRTTIPCP